MRDLLAIIASAKALSIGIDLGTSTSCCAVFRDGAPELRAGAASMASFWTPSVCVVASDAIRLHENEALKDNEVLVTSWKRAISWTKKRRR